MDIDVFVFDERLYMLNVEDVPQYEVPRIIDPNDENSGDGVIVCYEPDKKQTIQLSLIIWQVATQERNRQRTNTPMFDVAEKRCTSTRNALKSLLLPFVDGDNGKARDLCLTLLRLNNGYLKKYLSNWSIIKRPEGIWIDRDSNRIFLARYKDRVVVGLNPLDCVFVYNRKK